MNRATPANKIDISIDPSNALKNPSTSTPGTIAPANISSSAFITNVSSPKVRILTGSVTSSSIGFIVRFIRPMTIASKPADQKFSTSIPGIIHAVKRMASA